MVERRVGSDYCSDLAKKNNLTAFKLTSKDEDEQFGEYFRVSRCEKVNCSD